MAVIKEFMDGNCRVVVYDDYFVSPEEWQKRLDRVGELYIEMMQKRVVKSEGAE